MNDPTTPRGIAIIDASNGIAAAAENASAAYERGEILRRHDEERNETEERGRMRKLVCEMEAEIARLRAALQPFADAFTAERWTWLYADTRCDHADVADMLYANTGVTLGMLRAAKAALGET